MEKGGRCERWKDRELCTMMKNLNVVIGFVEWTTCHLSERGLKKDHFSVPEEPKVVVFAGAAQLP